MQLELYAINKKLSELLGRYHMILFILLASISLIVAIFLLYQSVNAASDTSSEIDNSALTSFDQKTIDKIKDLQDSSNGNAELQLPTPRANPFFE